MANWLVRDKLHSSISHAGGKDAIWHQLEVQILFAQQLIHELNNLHDKLVLAKVVSAFEQDRVCSLGILSF